MGANARICPSCGKSYDRSQKYCEHDGAALIDEAASTPVRSVTSPARRSRKKEIAVGIVIVLLLVGTISTILVVRQARVYRLHVTFEEGAGLKVGDPVYVKGADVGEVVNARFDQGQFLVTIEIRPDAVEHMRQESMFFIGFDKIFLNRKCVTVFVIDDKSPPLENGQTVKGTDSWVQFYAHVLRHQGPQEALRLITTVKEMVKEGVISFKGSENDKAGN